MMSTLKDQKDTFAKYRHLLNYLIKRDFTVKYRRSFLGVLWSLLNPLLMSLVMGFVFEKMFQSGIEGVPLVVKTGLPPDFLVYVMSGQLILSFFNEATSTAMDSVLSGSALIKKVYIPKYFFPLEKVIFSLVNLAFYFVAFLLVIFLTGSTVSVWFLLTPLPILLLTVFNLGVGLILSSLVVYFRDIKHFYGILTYLLMFLTPIFYSESSMSSAAQFVIRLNPVYWFLSMFRQLAVYGAPPTVNQLVITTSCCIVSLVFGLVIFKKTQDNFILYV